MTRTVLWLSVLVLASCSGRAAPPPKADGGDGGLQKDGGVDAGRPVMDGGLPLDQACEVLVEARCNALVACGLYEDSADGGSRCRTTYATTWCGPTTWPSRVALGTLTYDARRAEDCARSLDNRDCHEVEELPDACSRFLLPRAQLKQRCYGGYDECVEGVCRGGTCPRSCQARGLSGETCHGDSDCQSRLYCRLLSQTPGIGVCSVWGATTAACDATTLCGAGLSCDENTCVLLPSAPMQCLKGLCEETSWCAPNSDGGTCLTRKNRSAPCAQDNECLQGLVCEPLTGQCEASELTQAGAPCGLKQTCPLGTTCVGVTPRMMGTCQAPLGQGLACGAATDCEPHLSCVSGDGGQLCGPRRGLGAACGVHRDCQLDARCVGGTCVPLPFAGEDCTATRECAWGRCQDVDAGAKCLAASGPGATCREDRDCASAQCVLGTCTAACNP